MTSEQESQIEIVDVRTSELEELIKGGQPGRAKRLANEILADNHEPKVYQNLSSILETEKNYKKAIGATKQAIKHGLDNAENWYKLAQLQERLYHKHKKYTLSEAVKCFKGNDWLLNSFLTVVSPILFSMGAYNSILSVDYREDIMNSYQEAIKRESKPEYHLSLLNFLKDDSKELIKYGEEAFKKHPDSAEICSLLSKAYEINEEEQDSYAMMIKAIDLKMYDGDFIREHFFERLGESVDDKPCPYVYLMDNRNWDNYSVLSVVTDFFKKCDLAQDYLNNEDFTNLSRAKVRQKSDDLEGRYDLACSLAMQSDDISARNEAIAEFSELLTRGYDIRKNDYLDGVNNFLYKYRNQIKPIQRKQGKPDLKLFN